MDSIQLFCKLDGLIYNLLIVSSLFCRFVSQIQLDSFMNQNTIEARNYTNYLRPLLQRLNSSLG